ncbi:MAG: AAA family ATPase, partial [Oscillospiraceae bacterium]
RASLIKTTFELDDVILPPAQKRQLLFACGQIRNQHIVYDDWGYGKHISYGRGTSLLLYGPPGTGKTMAAGAIANRLGLELYRVDISKIVDKYIGETEKNIGEIFDRAKQCSVVLFFDEADALFSKRSEVGSSNDRHANMETGFLLQCVEDYDGISILATNYKQNIDPAFLRRIKFTVEFPAPQADIRRTLWIKSFPKESPLDKTVDFDFLSERFELSGGNIKNIAVNSAFYAAEHGSMIGMEAIVNCIYAELQKNHMVTDSSYFAQYSTFLQL